MPTGRQPVPLPAKRIVGKPGDVIKTKFMDGNIYEEFFYQTAAYSAMLKELELYTIEGMVIVNLKKDGTFKVEQNMDVEGNLEAFKAALVLFKKKNNK